MSGKESARLAREVKNLMDAIADLVQGAEEPFLPDDAGEQLENTVVDQAYVALTAADDWAMAKEHLHMDEELEWLHLYRVARLAPFTVHGIATDPDLFVLSDLYDLLRDALKETDRVEAAGLAGGV